MDPKAPKPLPNTTTPNPNPSYIHYPEPPGPKITDPSQLEPLHLRDFKLPRMTPEGSRRLSLYLSRSWGAFLLALGAGAGIGSLIYGYRMRKNAILVEKKEKEKE